MEYLIKNEKYTNVDYMFQSGIIMLMGLSGFIMMFTQTFYSYLFHSVDTVSNRVSEG